MIKKISYMQLFLLCCFGTMMILCIFNIMRNRKNGVTTNEQIEKTGFALDTVITITLYGNKDEKLLTNCFHLCNEYERIFSRTHTSGDVYKMNQELKNTKNPACTFVVSDSIKEVVERSIYYSRESDGGFDFTIEPVSSLWNFKDSEKKIPSDSLIIKQQQNVNYEKCRPEGNELTLEQGMGLDFGAIAKGYIADQLKEYLLSEGVTSAVINLGGNILCIGKRTDGSPFQIGIRMPFGEQDEIIAAIYADDISVVSSGIYERYFEKDHRSYHHLLDPKTGYPFENDLIGVTIISKHSVDGDGLSTACFSMGLEKGLAYLNEKEDVYGVFITSDKKMHFSEGFEGFMIR